MDIKTTYPVKIIGIASNEQNTLLKVATDPGIQNEVMKFNTGQGIHGEIRIDDGRGRTGKQNKFIHSLINDIAQWTGEWPEYEKRMMFYWWCALNDYDYTSTTELSMTEANSFIDFLLEFIIEHGIQADHPILEELVAIKDISRYLWICLKYKKCCICGKPGQVHHVNKIGMGNNRYTLDDSNHRKICLCENHHLLYKQSIHNIGDKEFFEKYKVYGIIYNDE